MDYHVKIAYNYFIKIMYLWVSRVMVLIEIYASIKIAVSFFERKAKHIVTFFRYKLFDPYTHRIHHRILDVFL